MNSRYVIFPWNVRASLFRDLRVICEKGVGMLGVRSICVSRVVSTDARKPA